MAMYDRWEFDSEATYIAAFPTTAQESQTAGDASTSTVPSNLSNDALMLTLDPASGSHSTRQAQNTVVYSAIFLSGASRARLLQEYPAQFGSHYAEHVTLCHAPSAAVLSTLPIGQVCQLEVVHHACDAKCQAVEVRILSDEVAAYSSNLW